MALTATPDAGATFAGWGDACQGSSATCVVRIGSTTTYVTATFDWAATLWVTKTGSGDGVVSSSPVGIIQCGAMCRTTVADGETLTLAAAPDVHSRFAGWVGGPCDGSLGTCTLAVSGSTIVTARFDHDPPAVATPTVPQVGTTTATVTATVDPAGASLGDCHFDYGLSASYGSQAPCVPEPSGATGPADVSAALSGLTPGTTYHYRLVATNVGGTTAGADQTFTTLALPLTCATERSLCPPGVLRLHAATATAARGFATIELACDGPGGCDAHLVLAAATTPRGRVFAGRAHVVLAGGERQAVRVRLSHLVRPLLRHRHRVRATLSGPGFAWALTLAPVR